MIITEERDLLKNIKSLLPYAELNNKDAISKLYSIIKNLIIQMSTIDNTEISLTNSLQSNIRSKCNIKEEKQCLNDIYCTYKNNRCSIKIPNEELLNKFIKILTSELIFNRIRRSEILEKHRLYY